jgi:hypothetical protein
MPRPPVGAPSKRPWKAPTSYVVAAADTAVNFPSAELLREVFPGTPLTRDLGEHEGLLSIERAREVLGFEPRRSRRDATAGS